MRIELRFALILVGCLIFGVGIAGYISYTLEFRGARDETVEKSRVFLEMASAMREYTFEEVAPLVRSLGSASDAAFHPQVVPSYGAQSALTRLHQQFPDYAYRESSLNPTNVADRASDWEVGLIRAFHSDPTLKELSGETGEGDSLRYFLARPLRMTTRDCLECHSTPDVAPKAMIARYGSGNGFGWVMNDVIGLQLVEVPVLRTKLKALHGVLVTVGSLACVLVLTIAIFILLLRRYVFSPLESITRRASATSLGVEMNLKANTTPLSGQFLDLERSIHRLKVSLDEALRLFKGSGDGDRKA